MLYIECVVRAVGKSKEFNARENGGTFGMSFPSAAQRKQHGRSAPIAKAAVVASALNVVTSVSVRHGKHGWKHRIDVAVVRELPDEN
jgi:hypothetical protein